jgi:hypothetical protein
MTTATRARDRAIKLAKDDPRAALHASRSVDDPWYRTQALAWVARFTEGKAGAAIAEEALRTSQECADLYQAVAVTAWPLRALIERGDLAAARRELQSVMGRLPDVCPASSRSVAALTLLQACFDLGPEVRRELVGVLAATAAADEHWRIQRNLVDALGMLHATEPALASELAAATPHAKTRRRALEAFDAPRRASPRPFFW